MNGLLEVLNPGLGIEKMGQQGGDVLAALAQARQAKDEGIGGNGQIGA